VYEIVSGIEFQEIRDNSSHSLADPNPPHADVFLCFA
jgi:hypothetical protein